MDMTGEYRIAAPRAKVWAALNDPEVLRQAIPGCDEIEKLSDTEMTAKVTAKVGPVKAKFGGKVTLSDIDPPNGYTISGEGSGGAAGFAKGGADVRLAEANGETVLSYTVRANVGGKLAQIGSRLIDATARKMADEFFGNFAALVATPAAPGEPAPEASPPETAPSDLPPEPVTIGTAAPAPEGAPSAGLHPAIWIVGLIVIVAVLLWFFAR
ncbi:MAG TPA: carbon monoxide dehydrogenase subunit G [Stellaceae bacterium]|nr:carbon monoxide dehydrogenase subunit G [Stellaceae bacterium]